MAPDKWNEWTKITKWYEICLSEFVVYVCLNVVFENRKVHFYESDIEDYLFCYYTDDNYDETVWFQSGLEEQFYIVIHIDKFIDKWIPVSTRYRIMQTNLLSVWNIPWEYPLILLNIKSEKGLLPT